ncbi:MAG: hypothetical protein IKN54_09140 [Lachnospiraceae bacterium]|nr:hypothetical protein [Lachnospiraceae bacterium]
MKDGDHLVHSTKNPERVRGQSRDAENKNPDLIEWEPVEVENPSDCEQLTPAQEKLAQELGKLLAVGSIWLIENVAAPWWKESAWPWIKDKYHETVLSLKRKKTTKAKMIIEQVKNKSQHISNTAALSEFSDEIDKVFDNFQFNMDEPEAKQHLMNIMFHILELANEIRILSNMQIKKESGNEEQYLKRVETSEAYLTEKVAEKINQLLSDDKLAIDVTTSKEIFSLMGGGVRINGEYVPVEIPKVYQAIQAQR